MARIVPAATRDIERFYRRTSACIPYPPVKRWLRVTLIDAPQDDTERGLKRQIGVDVLGERVLVLMRTLPV